MSETISQITSSVNALLQEYETITHNLANINTSGYKRQVNAFSREMMKQLGNEDQLSVNAAEISADMFLDFSQGSFLGTDRPLDLAISGTGFFVIETPDGPRYTRNGVLQINKEGQLVNLDGRIVAGVNGPIIIPNNVSQHELMIGENGSVKAGTSVFGHLKVVDFGEDENLLIPIGSNNFQAPDDLTAENSKDFTVRQGYQEQSNVKMVEELVRMMHIQRLYETHMKLLVRERENAKTMLSVASSA